MLLHNGRRLLVGDPQALPALDPRRHLRPRPRPVAPWGPSMAYGRDPPRPRAGDQFLLEQGMTPFVVRTSTGGRALVESGWPWRRTLPGSLSVRTAGGRDRLRRPSPGPWGFTKGRRGEGCAGRGRRRRPSAAG